MLHLDGRTDLGSSVVCERVKCAVLDFYDSHNVVPFNSDLVGSTVFDDDFAVFVLGNAD